MSKSPFSESGARTIVSYENYAADYTASVGKAPSALPFANDITEKYAPSASAPARPAVPIEANTSADLYMDH